MKAVMILALFAAYAVMLAALPVLLVMGGAR